MRVNTVDHRAHIVGANQFTAAAPLTAAVPPTMDLLRSITVRPTIIMGQGIITVRDGATIVLGDVSSQEGSEARGCGRLGKPKAYRVDRGDQGGRAPQDIGQRRTTTRAVPVSQRGCRTGSLSALCCPGVGLYLYNLRMAGSWADACPQAPAG